MIQGFIDAWVFVLKFMFSYDFGVCLGALSVLIAFIVISWSVFNLIDKRSGKIK